MCNRLAGNPAISAGKREAYAGRVRPMLDMKELSAPRRKKKPATIAVQFMGDLFFERLTQVDTFPVFNTIMSCPQHVFFTLTKRIGRMHRFAMKYWIDFYNTDMPKNIYHGLTVCTQKEADEKIPLLLEIPGFRWLSIEPMLEHIDIGLYLPKLDFIVAGCESGPGRRPSKLEWFKSLSDQCGEADIPFYLKQADRGYGVEEIPYGPENVPPMPDGLK